MSAGVTRAFLPMLRRLDEELAIPLSERMSVLRELEADLEDFTGRLVSEGHSVEDARAMAVDTLVPNQATLGDLRRVHASAYARATGRLDGARLRMLERTALVVATGGVLAFESLVLLQTDLRYDPSPFLWPVLGAGALLFAAIIASAFAFWIKGDHGEASRSVGIVLALSGLVLALGFAGAFMDFFWLVQSLERVPDAAYGPLLQWLRRAGVLLSVTMLLSMAGGLTWFIMTQWLSALAAARRELLGLRPDNKNRGDTNE